MTKYKDRQDAILHYFKRYASHWPDLYDDVNIDVKTAIVIPVYAEPDLIKTLKSLFNADLPLYPVRVFLVFNQGVDDGPDIRNLNQRIFKEVKEMLLQYNHHLLTVFPLFPDDFPAKKAGVGYARKIGMDCALWRFYKTGVNGAIVCLDADCEVSSNYLTTIEGQFSLNNTVEWATIYFEHPLNQTPELNEAIIYYELYLRYYVQALKWINYPFAFHTIGSSMACKAGLYARMGGMNTRKAAEDFYFLHKIAPGANGIEINDTVVYASARCSERVPFGTGKAQQLWINGNPKSQYAYNLSTFIELRKVICNPSLIYEKSLSTLEDMKSFFNLNKALINFLEKAGFEKDLNRMVTESKSEKSFIKKFWQWWNGFRVLKWAHFYRDNCAKEMPLVDQAERLLSNQELFSGENIKGGNDRPMELLMIFRSLDQKTATHFQKHG